MRAVFGVALSVLSLAVLVLPRAAHADDRELSEAVSVDAGASCLDAETLLSQLRVWLKRDRIDDRIAVVVRGDAHSSDVVGFVLERDGEQMAERRFDPAPPRCADLHAALGLAIALAIDASVLADLGIEPAQPEPAPAPAPVDADGATQAPRLRSSAALLAMGAVAVPASLSVGGALRFELGWVEWLDLRFGAMSLHAPRTPVVTSSAALTLIAGRVDVCARKASTKVAGRLCVGPTAGTMLVQGRGFEGENLSGVAPSVGFAVGGDLQFFVSPRVGLSLGLDAFVPVVGPVLTVLSEDRARVVAFQLLPPIGGILGFGPFFRFQ